MEREVCQKDQKIRHAAACLSAVGPANHAAARAFVDWKIQRDRRRTSSAAQYAQLARDLDRVLAGKRYHEMTHEDGDRYTAARATQLKPTSLDKELTQARHFLKWQLRNNGQPDLVDLPYRLKQSLSIRGVKRRVKKETPMTRDELNALLAVRKNDPCTQALYWLCFDAGIRIGEGLVLNVADFDDKRDGGAEVHIPDVEGAKTGDRDPYVVECMPAMRAWLGLHPLDGAPEAPLFTTLTRPYRRMSYRAAWGRLQRDIEAAGIRKDVHFHLFRKTSATRRARTLDPDQFTAFHGWAPGSKVATQYIMDSKSSSREAIRREAGITDEGQPVKVVDVGFKDCPFCAEPIKAAAIKCRHCGEMLGPRIKQN